jgi:hypothetical protein
VESTEFQYPHVTLGTMVRASKDHVNFSKPKFGWVVEAKTRSASILLPPTELGHGFQFIDSALHRHDPQVKTKPDRFDPIKGYADAQGNPASGVFELADTEVRIRQIEKDYRELRTTMMAMQEANRALAQRLAALEAAMQPPSEPAPDPPPTKRGPGRPRKQLQEVA